MADWHLNEALTSWRSGVNTLFPGRRKNSDGTIGDQAHSSRDSEHNPDPDGSVDAFDMDVNLLGSGSEAGSASELRLIEALKRDFEADRRAGLWIHDREIASAAIDDWRERDYGGDNPHDRHVHWQSNPAHERDGRPWRFETTTALLREMTGTGGVMLPKLNPSAKPSEDVKYWQYMLRELGFAEQLGEVDGVYGPRMQTVVNASRRALKADAGTANEITGWHAVAMQRALAQKYAGRNGAPGAPGAAGKDGAPGRDGRDGLDGRDGVLSGTLRIDGGVLQATAVQGG